MKIETFKTKHKKKFFEICAGYCFEHDGKIFLKHQQTDAAVNVESGFIECFYHDTEVLPLDCVLLVKGYEVDVPF